MNDTQFEDLVLKAICDTGLHEHMPKVLDTITYREIPKRELPSCEWTSYDDVEIINSPSPHVVSFAKRLIYLYEGKDNELR